MLYAYRWIGPALACFAIVAVAQPQSPTEKRPQIIKRVPDASQQYSYTEQIKAMTSPSSDPDQPQDAGIASAITPSDVKSMRSRTDVALTATAIEAIRVSEKWRTENNSPAAGPDGRVLYSFGAGLATLVCAPLRVCIIELQAGEKIVGEPQIGDSVRWNISPGMYGVAADATSVIVLKPQVPGLDTNLLITTDRRAYYLRLVSKPEDYVARVAFVYPEDDSAKRWQKHMVERQALDRQAKRAAEVLPAMVTAEKLNLGYRVDGGNQYLRPLRVYDDGSKTYIQMRPEIRNREAPVLVVLGSDGKGEMTNYRVREHTYIVDRLFDRARLVLGTGKKAQKVEISREPRG
jgi:type IV secretion system protein TrbG